MNLSRKFKYKVEASDPTPDGYHDYLAYTGNSLWQVWKAIRAARANEMNVTVEIRHDLYRG